MTTTFLISDPSFEDTKLSNGKLKYFEFDDFAYFEFNDFDEPNNIPAAKFLGFRFFSDGQIHYFGKEINQPSGINIYNYFKDKELTDAELYDFVLERRNVESSDNNRFEDLDTQICLAGAGVFYSDDTFLIDCSYTYAAGKYGTLENLVNDKIGFLDKELIHLKRDTDETWQIKFEFKDPRIVTTYKIWGRYNANDSNQTPSNWELRAAIDKENYDKTRPDSFVVLDVRYNQHTKFENFDNTKEVLASDNPQYANVYNISNPNSTPYKYYVLHVTENGGHVAYCTISEIGLYDTMITINGKNIITITKRDINYVDAGATAIDHDGSDISDSVETVSDPVYLNIVGEYTIKYTVKKAIAKRIVKVIEPGDGIDRSMAIVDDECWNVQLEMFGNDGNGVKLCFDHVDNIADNVDNILVVEWQGSSFPHIEQKKTVNIYIPPGKYRIRFDDPNNVLGILNVCKFRLGQIDDDNLVMEDNYRQVVNYPKDNENIYHVHTGTRVAMNTRSPDFKIDKSENDTILKNYIKEVNNNSKNLNKSQQKAVFKDALKNFFNVNNVKRVSITEKETIHAFKSSLLLNDFDIKEELIMCKSTLETHEFADLSNKTLYFTFEDNVSAKFTYKGNNIEVEKVSAEADEYYKLFVNKQEIYIQNNKVGNSITYEFTNDLAVNEVVHILFGSATFNVSNKPVITLNGNVNTYSWHGITFIDPGAYVDDVLNSDVTVSGNVGDIINNTYELRYSYPGAVDAIRRVKLISVSIITLNGNTEVDHIYNTTYIEQGATVGANSLAITNVTGVVGNDIGETYEIKYSYYMAVDVIRKVTVIAKPIIKLTRSAEAVGEEPTEPATAGGDPVIKPFFGSGYKVKLPDLPGHVYRLLQGGGVTINTEIMACPADKACFLRTRPVLFSDQKIIEGTYLGKILIDVKDISFRHTIDLSQGIGCVECNLPDGASWDGDLTDGEIKNGVDPDYKGKYKQRILSVSGGAMKFVVRIYEHPQVQNEFRVLRCNIDPSVHDGLLMRNYKPKLFFLNDLCDTRILSKHKNNSTPLTFRHPVLKNQVIMKCG